MSSRRDRNQDRESLLSIAKELLAEQDYNKQLDLLVRRTIELLRADRGFLVLIQQDKFDYKVVRNWSPSDYEANQEPISRSIINEVIAQKNPTLIEDASHDERFIASKSVHRLQVRSVLAAPIYSSGGPLGVLYLESHSIHRFFGAEELALFVEILALSSRALEASLQQIASSINKRYDMGDILTQDEAFLQTLEHVFCVAAVNLSILLQGASGTGKELLARAIHANSPRAKKPFIAINCAALSPNLLESELFGHVKGAFTGANQNKTGLIAAAHEGTLFLDEIGELPKELQPKLLRALQLGEVMPVGATQAKLYDVRFVAATNRDLEEDSKSGHFREDLFYRLSGFSVQLPPLSARRGDIPLLLRQFIEKASAAAKRTAPSIPPEVWSILQSYQWPGNIRELENEAQRLVALSANQSSLSVSMLSPKIAKSPPQETGKPPSMDEQKKALVEHHLKLANGNRSLAAKNLGLSREGLRQLMKRLGLETPTKE
jgi:transcriptional regulator with GAF, ATPase, and Fis domain